MIGSLLSRMADAEKLSPQQLQQSEKDGMIPQGIGQLISQDNASMQSASKPIPQAPQGTVVDQIMQQATQSADPLVLIDHKINQLSKENLRLQEGIQTGEIKPYIGIPKLAEQVKELESLKSVKQQLEGKNQPVEDTQGIQSLQESAPQQTAQVNPQSPQQGIESVPTNLPTETMADGGIVAFANGGFNEVDDEAEDDELQKLFPSSSDNDDLLNELVSSGYNAPQEKPTEQPKANEGIKSVVQPRSVPSASGSNFDKAMAFVLPHEGGYANYKEDKGGPTNRGVTQATLSTYLGRPASIDDVKNLDEKTARDIYKTMFWDKIEADKLDPKVAMMAFDTAVGSGIPKAKKMLSQYGDDHEKFLEAKKQWMKDIVARDPSQKVWDRGWQNRMADLGAYTNKNFAEGGIVALAKGGEVKRYNGTTINGSLVAGSDAASGLSDLLNTTQRSSPSTGMYKSGSDVKDLLRNNKFNITGGLLPAGVLLGGSLATSEAGNIVRNNPTFREQVTSDPMLSALSGDAGFASSIMDNASNNIKDKSLKLDTSKKQNTDASKPSGILTPPNAAKEQQQDIDASSNYSNTPATIANNSVPTLPNPPVTTGSTTPTLSATDDFFNKYLNQLQQERDESKQGAETNKYLALLQAGLDMMGGTSPYAAANIGQGASQGIAAFSNLEKSRQENERNLGNQMLGLYKYKTSADVAKENQAANRELRMAGLNMTKEQRDATLKLEQDKLKDLNDQRAQSNLYNATKLVEADYNKDINNMGKSEAEKTAYIYNHPLVKDAAQKAGLDLSKYTSQPVIPSAEIEALKKNPSKKKEFEAKFKVSADQYLR